MALTPGSAELGTGLAGELYSAINLAFGGPPAEANVDADRKKMLDVLASTIIAHFKANADIAVTVTSVSGVTTGLGISGAGSGSGSLT